MEPKLLFHLSVIGLWFIGLSVELYFELVRRLSESHHEKTAKIHYAIDLFYEGPLLVLVLISGYLLLTPAHLSGLFLIKVICGSIAIGVNALCIIPVVKRKRAVDRKDYVAIEKNSHLIDLSVVVGVPFGGVAVFIAAYQYVITIQV